MYKYIYYCLLIYNIKYVKYKHMSFFEMQTYISWVRVSTGPKNFKDMVVFRCIFIGSWLPICFCKSCVVTHIQFFWGSVCGLWTLDLAPWILNACTNLNHDNGRTVLALFFLSAISTAANHGPASASAAPAVQEAKEINSNDLVICTICCIENQNMD